MALNKSDFPILCETCLGNNPFIRMTMEKHGTSCKICDRPFHIFRWRPGANARFKKTQICKTCSQLKNVCQTCILDLQFGLPVQVRDKALADKSKIDIPTSVANRDFQFEQYEKSLEENNQEGPSATGMPSLQLYAKAAGSEYLSKLARKRPYYTRNLPHLCSFFEKGECKRGTECPYRHEENTYPEELKNQKYKNRFYGVDDPVAQKLLKVKESSLNERFVSEPPEDESITTLFVGGIDDRILDLHLIEKLKNFGEISTVNMVPLKACAFVTFVNRSSAESAMTRLKGEMFVNEVKLKVNWSKVSNKEESNVEAYQPPPGMKCLPEYFIDPVTNAHVQMPRPPPLHAPKPPGSDEGTSYPSMNPNNYAAQISQKKKDKTTF